VIDELNDIYQQMILDHNRSPRNRRPLADPDRRVEGYNPLCGDHITVFLKLADNIVQEVTFEGSGCAICTASASMMTEALKGKTLEEAKSLFKKFHALVTGGSHEVIEGPGLGKLEVFSGVCRYPARVKCATLAWHTVEAAMEDREEQVTTE
jgi:nitrogen fixation NifU-like protein